VGRCRQLGLDTSWKHLFDLRRLPSLPPIFALGLMLNDLRLLAGSGRLALRVALWFLTQIFTTSQGWILIILGEATGLAFAVTVLSISVVSFPMLLDRNLGIAVAVHTSISTVLANPLTVALWGLIVTASLMIGYLFAFVGLAFVVPVLAHASWHRYRRVVQ
jgi:uncharacterized membrane protein